MHYSISFLLTVLSSLSSRNQINKNKETEKLLQPNILIVFTDELGLMQQLGIEVE